MNFTGLSDRFSIRDLGITDLRESSYVRRAAIPVAYLAVIALAEFVTAGINASLGLPLHALILCAMLLQGATTDDADQRSLLWGVALAPLIRILSLSLPLMGFPLLYWFAIISAPVFVAAYV